MNRRNPSALLAVFSRILIIDAIFTIPFPWMLRLPCLFARLCIAFLVQCAYSLRFIGRLLNLARLNTEVRRIYHLIHSLRIGLKNQASPLLGHWRTLLWSMASRRQVLLEAAVGVLGLLFSPLPAAADAYLRWWLNRQRAGWQAILYTHQLFIILMWSF